MAKMFIRRIPDAGTPSRDFILEDFLPNSWQEVKNLLSNFINNPENAPIGRTIEGEWGSGKSYITLFLENLIKVEEEPATILPIPMGMIHKLYKEDFRFLNYYKNSAHMAELLLCAIFIAGFDKAEKLREENIEDEFSAFSETYNKIHKPEQSITLSDYVYKNLNMLTDNGNKKLYIFLDEMEELIEKEKGNEIFESISAIFNEDTKVWGKGQKYGKTLRILLACTPEALFKFQTNPRFSEIYGKTFERAKEIKLPKLPRADAFKFLIKAFQWATGDMTTCTKDLQISSEGVLETITKVSQGNFRHLQSFASTLVSKSIDSASNGIISFNDILTTFPHLKVTDRFGNIDALNIENLNRLKIVFEEKFGKDSQQWFLLNLFLGEQNPFSIKELSEYLKDLYHFNLQNIEIIQLIHDIENLIKSMKFSETPFIKLKLLDEYNFEEIIQKLSEFCGLNIKKEEKKGSIYIRKNKISEDLDDIEKNLVFFKFSDEEDLIREQVYFGIDKVSMQTQFGSLIKGFENELIEEFELNSSIEFYKLSNDFLEKFYPSPIPISLSYITNDQLRRNLWKEVKNNYETYFESDIIQAFTKCFKENNLDIKLGAKFANNLFMFNYTDTSGNEAQIKVKLFSHFGVVNRETPLQEIITDYEFNFRNKKPYHLAILLHGEEFNKVANSYFQNYSGLKKEAYILPIKINFNLGRRLIITNITQKEEYKEDIDISALNIEKRKILVEEINFIQQIIKIFETWKLIGKLIDGLKYSEFAKISKIINIFAFYIKEEDNLTLKNLIEKYKIFHRDFKIFYSKIFNFPDFDKGDIESELDNLIDNNFLNEKLNDEKKRFYEIINTPVEERLIRIFQELNTFTTFDELKKYFIVLDQNSDNYFSFKKSNKKDIKINNIYLLLLERKGIVRIDKIKEIIQLENMELKKRNLMQSGNELISTIQKSIEHNNPWIYIYKKGHNKGQIINFENTIKFIKEKLDSIENKDFTHLNLLSLEDLKKLITLSNIEIYFKQLFEKYYPIIIENGIKEINNIHKDFQKEVLIFKDLKIKLKNKLNIDIKLENILENNRLNELKQIYEKKIESNEINDYLKDEEEYKLIFDGSGGKLKNYHFSPKINYLIDIRKEYMEIINIAENLIKEIVSIIDLFNWKKTSIKSRLVKIEEIKNLFVHNKIYHRIRDCHDNFGKNTASDFIDIEEEISLPIIKETLNKNHQPLTDELTEIENAINTLDTIQINESQFLDEHNTMSNFLDQIAEKFISIKDFNYYKKNLEDIYNNYQNIFTEIKFEKYNKVNVYSTQINQKIEIYNNDIKQIAENINSVWRKKLEEFDIDSLEKKKNIFLTIDSTLIKLISDFIVLLTKLNKITIYDLWKSNFTVDNIELPDYNYLADNYQDIIGRMMNALKERYGQENVPIINFLFEKFQNLKTKNLKYWETVEELKNREDLKMSGGKFTDLIKELENDGILKLNIKFEL